MGVIISLGQSESSTSRAVPNKSELYGIPFIISGNVMKSFKSDKDFGVCLFWRQGNVLRRLQYSNDRRFV